MLDPKLLRTDPRKIADAAINRGMTLDIDALNMLETQRKTVQKRTENLQAKRNRQSKAIGQLKQQGGDAQALIKSVNEVNAELEDCRGQLHAIQSRLLSLMQELPNIPHPSVPIGEDESHNALVRSWGKARDFEFTPRDHSELGGMHGLLDFDAATRVAGSRFTVMRGPIAHLHRALIQFMLDIHTREHGYEEVNVPYLVNPQSCLGTGQLPKFADDLFHIEKQDLYLVPTAEVPVTNLVRDQILSATDLPLKYVCHSPCFRSEAGSYGRDVRGMIRQHQFEKVELVQLTRASESWDCLETLTAHAESILQRLELPYRVMLLCSGDLGFASAKTYDLEVWLPAQGKYREISSCSNFEDFQARRIQARWRNPEQDDRIELLHTLNGSGLAVGRTLVAILENNQDVDGNIHIPEALHDYLHGMTCIRLKQP